MKQRNATDDKRIIKSTKIRNSLQDPSFGTVNETTFTFQTIICKSTHNASQQAARFVIFYQHSAYNIKFDNNDSCQ